MWLLVALILFPLHRLHGPDRHVSLSPLYVWEGPLSRYEATETIDGLQIVCRLDTRPGPGYLTVELTQDYRGIVVVAYDTNPEGTYFDERWFPDWRSMECSESLPVGLLLEMMERAEKQ